MLTDDDPGDDPFQFPQLATLPAPLGDPLRRALRPEVRRRSTAIELRQALEAWLIPEGKSQPFVFGSGAVAHTTAELAGLCDQNWAEARQHLQNGDIDAWFRARNRHDLAAKAVSARLDADPDAALESFLRRLNPRLQPPRLVVEPMTFRFGRLSRRTAATRRLVLRNEGRGYAQATLSASVPWIGFDPPQTGCLAGDQAVVAVQLDSSALPLRRDHQAVIACTTARGSRLSIPVEAELDVLLETVLRVAGQLDTAFRRFGRGVRWGWSRWLRLFDSLLRSRVGLWILLVETLVLAGALVALSFGLRERPLDPLQLGLGFVQALPLALLAVYLLPALACVGLGILREGAGMLFRGP